MPLYKIDMPGRLRILSKKDYVQRCPQRNLEGNSVAELVSPGKVVVYDPPVKDNGKVLPYRAFCADFLPEALDHLLDRAVEGRIIGRQQYGRFKRTLKGKGNGFIVTSRSFSSSLIERCLDSFSFFNSERFVDPNYVAEISDLKPPSFLDKTYFDFLPFDGERIGGVSEETFKREKKQRKLTEEQERQAFQYFDSKRLHLRKFMLDYLVGKEYLVQNLVKLREQERNALSGIVRANLPLVVFLVKRTKIPHVEKRELFSEGSSVLLRSIELFDVTRGFKFSTYVCRAMLKAFNRVATKTGKYIERFPVSFDPDLEEEDLLKRINYEKKDHAVRVLKEVLSKNLAKLSKREIIIYCERFGIGGEKRTLESTGKIIGLTNERVRQIQEEALKKLRGTLEKEGL